MPFMQRFYNYQTVIEEYFMCMINTTTDKYNVYLLGLIGQKSQWQMKEIITNTSTECITFYIIRHT